MTQRKPIASPAHPRRVPPRSSSDPSCILCNSNRAPGAGLQACSRCLRRHGVHLYNAALALHDKKEGRKNRRYALRLRSGEIIDFDACCVSRWTIELFGATDQDCRFGGMTVFLNAVSCVWEKEK